MADAAADMIYKALEQKHYLQGTLERSQWLWKGNHRSQEEELV